MEKETKPNSNKHEAWELKQMQSLPLEAKIIKTQLRIREWYEHWNENVYVSFSGGKDSTVLLHIAREMYPDIQAVFCDTGLEYPEIRRFVKTFDNVEWIKPIKYDKKTRSYVPTNFKEIITEQGYPVISKEVSQKIKEHRAGYPYTAKYFDGTLTKIDGTKSRYDLVRWSHLLEAPFKISHTCCQYMKKNPFKQYSKKTKSQAMTGSLACESRLRYTNWIRHGCNAFDAKKPISNPLSFWTEQDVLQYILLKKLPMADVYGHITLDSKGNLTTSGVNRTGCMFCMFGCHLEKEPNRFQLMKGTHSKQYEYCMKSTDDGGLGLDKVLTWLNIPH